MQRAPLYDRNRFAFPWRRQAPQADKELVNRVFRAAHSIKGGAGFFDLQKIKELAHKLENVLDLIRSDRMVPNPEITNALLNGFDRLRELVADIDKSNDYDVSSYITSLNDLTSSYLESGKKASVRAVKTIEIPGASRPFEVDEYAIHSNLEKGNSIYLIRFDLIDDIHRKGRTPLDALSALQKKRRGTRLARSILARSACSLPSVFRNPFRSLSSMRRNSIRPIPRKFC